MRLFFWKDFIDLIFPRNCPICKQALFDFEPCLCTICQGMLPRANFHLHPFDNELTSKLQGLMPVHRVMAFLRFTKKGKSQALLHLLKYKNKPELGEELGRLYGLSLSQNGFLGLWDVLVAVPLHPLKKQRRGYNQSECFARGLSQSLGIPYRELLVRRKFTTTQTNKSRLERLDNVEDVFALNEGQAIQGLRILLVDDLLTTGATLCACAQTLLRGSAKHVDLATIAAGGH
ncbi:MAG: phosphoribosyltransferase family protein [Bacteroidetes bacterium]|nr:phosphoribosyltransferase family protein [Bacteroidota bacterium]MDA1267622.1 phosphoribosyltransferase family protein [Bacteroidota bacterium]